MRILLLLLLLSGCVQAKPIAVIGDSLTSAPNSWANVLNDNGQTLYIMAQPGRAIRDYEMPRDLLAYRPHYYKVIYFLGSVDIIEKTNKSKTEWALKHHLGFLLERNFYPVVILPPVFDKRKIGSHQVRAIIISVCDDKLIPYIDINEVWDVNWTTDGWHPNEYGQRVLAEFISSELEYL
jgi:hypothetical protein